MSWIAWEPLLASLIIYSLRFVWRAHYGILDWLNRKVNKRTCSTVLSFFALRLFSSHTNLFVTISDLAVRQRRGALMQKKERVHPSQPGWRKWRVFWQPGRSHSRTITTIARARCIRQIVRARELFDNHGVSGEGIKDCFHDEYGAKTFKPSFLGVGSGARRLMMVLSGLAGRIGQDMQSR